jgi:hypothetical protein
MMFYLKIALVIISVTLGSEITRAQEPDDLVAPEPSGVDSENTANWEHYSVLVPSSNTTARGEDLVDAEVASGLVETELTPDVFTHARIDLADLRLFSASGTALPYALRTLSPASVRDVIETTEFNRLEQADGVQELTLELPADVPQHNEVQIKTTGGQFRRPVEVDGSDDGQQWRRLVAANLIRFEKGDQKIDVSSLSYPDSRMRYVRIRIEPDPQLETAEGSHEQFKIDQANVLRTLELEGERSVWAAEVGPREPTRVYGGAGSSWIIDLQADHVPCDRIEVGIANREFVREVQIQAEQPSNILGQPVFVPLYSSDEMTWRRRVGEVPVAMTISFPEVRTGRLRLLVVDYRNVPLQIQSVKVSGAKRQVLAEIPSELKEELRLYYGNPLADAPNYDFARNLPAKVQPPPASAALSESMVNPNFVPPPLPFTERYPWLVYAVLGSACVALMLIVVSLAKQAVHIHDSAGATVSK